VKVVENLQDRRLSREQPLVQILVVVAKTQKRNYKLEDRGTEKGSVSTANVHGSAGPERGGKPFKWLRQGTRI